jgi:hypothetical protein
MPSIQGRRVPFVLKRSPNAVSQQHGDAFVRAHRCRQQECLMSSGLLMLTLCYIKPCRTACSTPKLNGRASCRNDNARPLVDIGSHF